MWRRPGLSLLALLAGLGQAASAQDHLEPERGSVNEHVVSLNRARELRETLLKDAPSNYRARVVVFPSFLPRWAVTLVREEGDQPAYHLEYAGHEGRAEGSGKAEVKRVRVPLDREAAEAVQKAWYGMLRGVRYPEKPHRGKDGTTYHFSRFVPTVQDDPLAPAGWETGTIWSPQPESPTGHLTAMAEALRKYALATEDARPKLREEILRHAGAIPPKPEAR